jgi:2,3-bisphosphoglycerate-independent phosphoglycerate mutase
MQPLFAPKVIENSLGEVVSRAGLRQLRIAETEKYPHVTFFFNGGWEESYDGEERIMVPSPKVATYDLQPEMSAPELSKKLLDAIESDAFDVVIVNFANTDMVGHTGVFSAAMKAAETVDACLGRVLACGKQYGYEAIVIADHGNSDYLINEDGTPNTAHTMNPVPFIYVGKPGAKVSNGKLADIAPTILGLMGIDLPIEMNGNNLISK